MIKLMKSTFYNEDKIKKELCDFIMNSEQLSMGMKCKEFEEAFAKYQGRKYAVLFNSGSSANLAIIQSLINLGRLRKGDKVGFSALTWATNVMPIIQLGLEPIPIDVSLKNLNVNSDNLLEVLSKTKLKAFFITNALGFSGDLDNIKRICESEGIILLEDNCESLGSELNNIKLGNFSLASTFSSFVGHHISTIEGGLVCTDDKEVSDMLILVRAHGWDRNLDNDKRKELIAKHGTGEFFARYTFYVPSYNLRPTEITGFIGLKQLEYMREINLKRNNNFKRFHSTALLNNNLFDLDLSHMNFISNFAYPLVFKTKESFDDYIKRFGQGVEIRPIISGSIIEQPFFKQYADEKGFCYNCPNAKRIHEFGFYFPNNPELTEDEINYLCSLLESNFSFNNILYKPSATANKTMKKALITGVTGQDGSYLAEFLLERGYEVHGLVRRTSTLNRARLDNIYKSATKKHKNFFLHYGDMTDSSSIIRILSLTMPDEIYNLAAQSHVKISFDIPEYTATADALGVLKLLEAARMLGLNNTRIYQASTSELFGRVVESPQKETTPFYPRSPYGIAKLYAYWIAKNYREAHNMFICNGILFNHESPRRGENFVSKKITQSVAAIKLGMQDKLHLGNLDAIRDWGYAKDYVESMWLMLQQNKPEDYVIATGEPHTVRELVELAFSYVGIKIKWNGTGLDEKGIDAENGKVLVDIDPNYFRPTEVDKLLGDSSKARRELGWSPKTKFEELVKMMVDYDIEEQYKKKLD